MKLISIEGPFREAKKYELMGLYKLEVEDIRFFGESFIRTNGVQSDTCNIRTDMITSGAKPENRSDWNEPGTATIYVEVVWYYSKPEPNCGWHGGFEIDYWEPIIINNVYLMSQKDREIVSDVIEKLVNIESFNWIREKESELEDNQFSDSI